MDDRIAVPAYRRIAAELRNQVAEGRLGVGSALPSTSQLMSRYGASSTVVRAAVNQLRAEGLVIGAPGKAVYVRTGAPAPPGGGTATGESGPASEAAPAGEAVGPGDAGRPAELAALREAVAELRREVAELRRQAGELRGELIDLYGRTGQPYRPAAREVRGPAAVELPEVPGGA